MRFAERLLLALSRDPTSADYPVEHYEAKHRSVEATTTSISSTFPTHYLGALRGARVLDIGCADGYEALALRELGAAEVVGIDIRLSHHAPACKGVRLLERDATASGFRDGEFDAAVTLSALEHFLDPEAVLREALRVVRPGGLVLITSGCWWGPWGSHMHFFCKVPWLNIWFSERTIMRVRRFFRHDGAMRYRECEGGLNDITLTRFERMVSRLGAEMALFKPLPVKGIEALVALPILREFLCHGFVAVLRRFQ
jgi:SAM-dependent methyltransferase